MKLYRYISSISCILIGGLMGFIVSTPPGGVVAMGAVLVGGLIGLLLSKSLNKRVFVDKESVND